MRRPLKRWIYRPVASVIEPIESMTDLALSLNLDKSTLSSAKQRRRCIGKNTTHITDWFYIIDDTFTKEEISILEQRVVSMLDNENWKPIFDGDYHVSNYGRVKSVKGKEEKILRQQIRGTGNNKYLSVYLRLKENGGKGKWYMVHRLVALAFIYKPDTSHLKSMPSLDFVVRIKNSMYNNTADNLYWADKKTLRLLSSNNGKNKPVVKIDAMTGEEVDYYSSITEAGKENFISYQSISLCVNGLIDSCLGFKWKFDTFDETLECNC